MAPNCPEYGNWSAPSPWRAVLLTTINPTYTPSQVHHQLRRLRRDTPHHRPDVPRDGHRCHGRLARDGGVSSSAMPTATPRSRRWMRPPLATRSRSTSTTSSCCLLLRHDRLVEGVMLDRSRPRRERRADHSRRRLNEATAFDRRAAVLPHLRHAGDHERWVSRRRHDDHDAALRSRALPAAAPGARRHRAPRGAADRRRAREAPLVDQYDLPSLASILSVPRRCPPRLATSAGGGSVARSCRDTA